jgi:hypothetical protein
LKLIIAFKCLVVVSNSITIIAVPVLGSVLPSPEIAPDQTIVTVRIEKIGLKDAAQFIDSFITISLKGMHISHLAAYHV